MYVVMNMNAVNNTYTLEQYGLLISIIAKLRFTIATMNLLLLLTMTKSFSFSSIAD